MAADTNFHEFDLTLTDQDLEDFLTVIEQQNGTALASVPAIPSAAIASIGGLQAQPHSNSTGSPSCSEDTGSAMMNDCAPAGPLHGSLESVHAFAVKSEGSPLDASAIVTCSDATALQASCALATSAPPGPSLVLPTLAGTLNSQCSLNLATSWPPQLVQGPGFSAAAMAPAMQQLLLNQQQQQFLLQANGKRQQQQQQLSSKQGSAALTGAQPPATLLVNAMGRLGTAGGMNGATSNQAAIAAGAAPMTLQHACSGIDSDKLVSHSTVEKQRRDRLNSLIEELGEMVPPSDRKYCNEGPNIRRPKHVVLSDTISLLHALQDKVKIEEAQIVQLRQQAAEAAAAAEGAAAAAAAARDPGHGMIRTKPDGAPELPSAPDNGMNATGVVVEQGPRGCLYVKINCKDRKGLLSDLVGALRSFPLVISTAAITTTQEGKVYDVFEVRLDDDSVTAEDVQCAIHTALYNTERVKGKRLRGNSS